MIRPTSNGYRRRARMTSAVAAVAASVVLAACAGTGTADTSGATTDAEAGTDDTAAFDEYRQCMADNGVDLPDPEDATAPERDPSDTSDGAPGEIPEPDADFEAAQEACADLAPAGAMGPGGRPPDDAEFQAYISCLEDNGVDVLEPSEQADSGQAPPESPPADGAPPEVPGNPFADQLDDSDPEVAAALEKCSVLLPSPEQADTGD